jgi:hypothetical protein
MGLWSFKGTPGLFNPHLIDALLQYRSLRQQGSNASEAAIQDKLEQIARSVDLAPSVSQTLEQLAGSRIKDPLIQQLYPDRNDVTQYLSKNLDYMPPVRVAEGLYITGKPHVKLRDPYNPHLISKVENIRTVFRGSNVPIETFLNDPSDYKSFESRMRNYAASTQSIYPTAFGLSEMTYSGFAFDDPNKATPENWMTRINVSAPALSISEARDRALTAYDELKMLGPEYVRAFLNKSSKSFYSQAFKPRQEWEEGVGDPYKLVTDESLTQQEINALWSASYETRALTKQADVERRQEQNKLQFSVPNNPLNTSADKKKRRIVVRPKKPPVVEEINNIAEGASNVVIGAPPSRYIKEYFQGKNEVDPVPRTYRKPIDKGINDIIEKKPVTPITEIIKKAKAKAEEGEVDPYLGASIEELMGSDPIFAAGFIEQDIKEYLGAYVPGQAGTNKGYSLESSGKGLKITRNKSKASGLSNAGEAELTKLPSGEQVLPSQYEAFRQWEKYRERGDEEGQERWKNWIDIGSSYERLWDMKAFDYFKRRQRKEVFGAMRGGDYEAAASYRAANNMKELEESILGVAASSREAKEALKEQAQTEKAHNRGLSLAANIRPYDWTRWYKTTNEAWGNVKQASSWMPSWLTSPVGRIGDSLMQQYGADVAGKKGIWDALMKGAVPLGAAIGSFAGIPGMLAGGAIGGVASAGSQMIGNWKEGQIRASGLSISSALNMVGGFVELAKVGIMGLTGIINLLKVPLNVLAKGLKIAVPSVVGFGVALNHIMTSGLKQMSGLGNPLSSLTQSEYPDYQRSQFADIMTGQSKGTTAGAVQNLASLRAGFFNMGRFSEDQLIDATLMGQFNSIFNNNAGNTYADYGNIVTSLAKQMQGQNDPSRQRTMYFLQHFDETMASQVERLLGHYDLGGNLSFAEYNDPRTYGFAVHELKNPEREQFRIASMGYQSINEAIDVSKMRIAAQLWDTFGKSVYSWVEKLYAMIANRAPISDVIKYIGDGLKSVWDATLGPYATKLKNNFGKMMDDAIDKVREKAPGILMGIVSVFPKISDFLIDVFYDLSQKIWDIFSRLLNTIGSIRINPEGIRKFLTNEGSWEDVFNITKSPATIIKENLDREAYTKTTKTDPNVRDSSPVVWQGIEGLGGFRFLGEGKYSSVLNEVKGYDDRTLRSAANSYQTSDTLKQFEDWELFFKKNNPHSWGSLYEGILKTKASLVRNPEFSLSDALYGLEAWSKEYNSTGTHGVLSENMSVYRKLNDVYTFSDRMKQTFNVADKEEAKAKSREFMETYFTEENISRGVSRVADTASSTINFILRIEDSEGKKVLEEAIKDLGNGAQKTIEAAFKAFSGMSSNVKHLSSLSWERSAMNALREQAANSQR